MDATPDAEIPVATLWPPDPTRRDRLVATLVFYGAFFIVGGLSFILLLQMAPLLFPRPDFVAVIRSSPTLGTMIASIFFGIVAGLIAGKWHLSRRFPERRDRVIFERMLRRKTSRDRAEMFADRFGRYDVIAGVVGLLFLFLFGLYCWIAWSTMYIGADRERIGWRGFSLINHERPASEVAVIYRTATYRQRTKETRPCVVVQFTDRTEIRSDEFIVTNSQCDELVRTLSEASGKPVTTVPWLNYVPKPK
jgi:hypothetical protein